MYNDVDGPTKPIADLDIACGRIPVHVIFGAVNDSVYVLVLRNTSMILFIDESFLARVRSKKHL